MSLSRRGLLGAASLSLAAGAGHAEADPPSRSWADGPSDRYGDALVRLQAYVEQHRRDYGLPGLTLCVVDADGYQAFITSGYSDVDRLKPVEAQQLFQVGSISKSMTALCLFRAVQAGKVSLATDVRTLVPGLKITTTDSVTLQTLLNHSSGLPDDAPIWPRVGDGGLWLGYRPGENWSYSNTGYALLTLAVEAIYGEPLERVVTREVFEPLGLAGAKGAIRQEDRAFYATGYCPAELGAPFPRGGAMAQAGWMDLASGAGNVAMAAPQMALYLRWLISAGRHRGYPILSDPLAKQWVSPTIAAPGWSAGASYANGLAVTPVDGRFLLHHTGGMTAFSSSLHVDPEAGVGCFASTNLGGVRYRPRDITAFACGLYRTSARRQPAPLPASTDLKPVNPGDYIGTYTGPGGELLQISASASGLTLLAFGRSGALEPAASDVLIAHHPKFRRYALYIERDGRRPAVVWYGDQAFLADPRQILPATPDALRSLAGRYDDPSGGSTRVVARPSGLFLDGVVPIIWLADGSWRPSEDSSPERVWFDATIGGVPQRMSYSGNDLWRTPDRVDPA